MKKSIGKPYHWYTKKLKIGSSYASFNDTPKKRKKPKMPKSADPFSGRACESNAVSSISVEYNDRTLLQGSECAQIDPPG